MTHRHDHVHGAEVGREPASDPAVAQSISRRKVVAAGVVGGLGIATVGEADLAEAAAADRVGTGRPGTTPVEFRGRIEQSGAAGQQFTAHGFLTRLAGVSRDRLFAGTPHDVSTALFTLAATGDLQARVLDMSVHSLDIVGTMAVHQRRHPGADFADPSTFSTGTVVARFHLRLQDVLAVYAAGSGIPTLTGDMSQTAAHGLRGPLAGTRFGTVGNRTQLFATGIGKLTDPVTLNALLEVAGHWTAV